MSSFARFACLLSTCCLVAGCHTLGGSKEGTSSHSGDVEPDRLLKRIPEVRDRDFETVPSYERRDPLEPEEDGWNEEAIAERRLLADVLFGLSLDDAPARANGLTRLARYDASSHRISMSPQTDVPLQRRAALSAAIVEALGDQHFDSLPDASSWDRAIAHRTVRTGDALLVALYDLLEAEGRSVSLERLAQFPELASEVPALEPWMTPPTEAEPITSASELKRRLTALTMRKGLTLAAAMYRANGWSGIELLRSQPPGSTHEVVRPDHWMAGTPRGEWHWPDVSASDNEQESGWTTTHQGTVGPAITSLWVGQYVSPRLARTIYSSWEADTYRHLEADSTESSRRFEWLSHWKTPSGARQIERVLEKGLTRAYPPDESTTQFAVTRRELTVAVTIGSEPREQLETAAESIAEAEFKLVPRRELPTSFQPTRRVTFEHASRRADRREGRWHEPAADLAVDLSSVESWMFRSSQTPPLRWFVRRDNGALIEMSVELADPLSADFASRSYREQLRRRFRQSLERADRPTIEVQSEPFDSTLTFQMTGRVSSDKTHKEGMRTLRVWQFERGDVRVTLSYQAPESIFAKHRSTARKLVESIESTSSPTENDENDDEPSGDGIIQFETEDS